MKHGFQLASRCICGYYAGAPPFLPRPYLGANPVFVVWILYSDTQSEEVPTTEWHLFNKRLSKRNLGGVWSAVHSLYKLNILEPKDEKGI